MSWTLKSIATATRAREAVKNASEVRLGGCARILVMAITLGAANTASGWIYPEHRDIAVLAVQGLDAERKTEFDQLWQVARAGDPQRMCAVVADSEQGVTPVCIDWAALSGVAGDHSCSSAEMLETVRKSDWILVVADVAAQLKVDLARIPVTAPSEQVGARLHDYCRRPASPRRRGESRAAPERAALRRLADAARGRAVRDGGRTPTSRISFFRAPTPISIRSTTDR